ncbi:MAG: cyclic pyranopterin monophosphate synthase MoaC [Chloroflexi bacterium]|nr:cyclic pyranopterin monophosphate synthase MoaC [Chloroflexota bacterium]
MTQGWQRKANVDLWEKLDQAVKQRKVRWEWAYRNTSPFHKDAHELAFGLAGRVEAAAVAPSAEKETSGVPVKKELTHLDEAGRARMVDIGEKPDTLREAVAKGLVRMQPSTFEMISKGGMPKGDVLAVARIAGIMAAKQTPFLIPLCHPIQISEAKVDFVLHKADSAVEIVAAVKSTGKTGVEMEALTAVAIAGLTIYDMCKAVDRGMRLEEIRLSRKSGGKSGTIALE